MCIAVPEDMSLLLVRVGLKPPSDDGSVWLHLGSISLRRAVESDEWLGYWVVRRKVNTKQRFVLQKATQGTRPVPGISVPWSKRRAKPVPGSQLQTGPAEKYQMLGNGKMVQKPPNGRPPTLLTAS